MGRKAAVVAPPEECCMECGKVITRRAIAHVYDERVVCTVCCRKLHAAEHRNVRPAPRRAERGVAVIYDDDPEPATEKQRRFCKELGVILPPDARKWQTSHLIDARLEQIHYHEAELAERLTPHLQRHGLVTAAPPRAQVSRLLLFWIIVCAVLLLLLVAGKL